jgi:hypothetical protein
MEQHIKILGVLNVVLGAMGALGGIMILIIFGGAYGIVGTVAHHEPEALIALPIIAIIGIAISILLLLLSAPAIITGIGLILFQSWARIPGIIISALHLLNFPIGTALGIYGLWVLLSPESMRCFSTIQTAYRAT